MESERAIGFGLASLAGSQTKTGALFLSSRTISVALRSKLAAAWLMYSCALQICMSGSCALRGASTWSGTHLVVLKGSSMLDSMISGGSRDGRVRAMVSGGG